MNCKINRLWLCLNLQVGWSNNNLVFSNHKKSAAAGGKVAATEAQDRGLLPNITAILFHAQLNFKPVFKEGSSGGGSRQAGGCNRLI